MEDKMRLILCGNFVISSFFLAVYFAIKYSIAYYPKECRKSFYWSLILI